MTVEVIHSDTDDPVVLFLFLLPGPHEAPVGQGGDQRLLQAQQQASRSGQPAPMGFQAPSVSQHGAPPPNQGLALPTQNAQTQHTHLPPHPHHLQSTPPPPNQASHPWAPPASHPLSSPPLTPQKVPHVQVSLRQTNALMWQQRSVCEKDQDYMHLFSCVGVFHVNVYFSCGWGNVCVWSVREVCAVCVQKCVCT